MEAFVPNYSHVVVLMFLLTGFVGFVGTVLMFAALLTRRWEPARRIFIGLAAISCLYGAMVLAVSLVSHETVLRAGERKYFCEVDCHLAYSVANVQTAKTLGSGDRQATSAGTFYVVTLRTFFDPETTSVNRGNGVLHPNLRMIRVLDDTGQSYAPSLEGLKALDVPAAKMVPLDQALRPGDTYETTFVFDLPDNAKNLRLWLTDPLPVNWVLIGHENSLLHKKVYFALDAEKHEASNR
ncbi:MAG TPA: hypothetical protein VGQ11_07155 [Candidatus Acidoferrales bacterium]|jgi:hypothetical protein|nr:hypothetical protein [Candidatus Acidoferrales bacterium]